MNHTKEPWRVHLIDRKTMIASDVENGYLAETRHIHRGDIELDNAKRIVACVNACADVEDDCLEQGYVKWLQQRIVELELSVMNLKEENARMKAMNNHLVTNGDLAFCEMTEGKVIGNIHDNHELLS